MSLAVNMITWFLQLVSHPRTLLSKPQSGKTPHTLYKKTPKLFTESTETPYFSSTASLVVDSRVRPNRSRCSELTVTLQ